MSNKNFQENTINDNQAPDSAVRPFPSNSRFSFSACISLDPADLADFLDEDVDGFSLKSRISHIYIENPFRLMLDGPVEKRRNEEEISVLAGVINSRNIEPVFVFDYTCMGDHQATPEFHENFGSLVGFLDIIGIISISVADLYLAEIFSTHIEPYSKFSHFNVFLSPLVKLNHAVKFKYLGDFIYKMATLHPDMNQNEDEIRRVISFIGANRIELLLNSGCIIHCPLETFCRAMEFHIREESIEPDEEIARTYYVNQCNSWLRKDPSLFERIPLVSPVELSGFESMGICNFRILNDPGSIKDIKSKVLPYLTGRKPENDRILIYGRESLK